ncbi:Ras modification protein ERF4 [Pseudozyma hubeiensis]|nr:Ras modification protein ERF4 [Pseudozyma hubeiensis]
MAGLEKSNIAPTHESSTAMTPETSTAVATVPTTISPSSQAKEDESNAFYPPPTSSYYFGPPDSTRAFGEPITGKPGVHLPKEIVRIERDYSSGELPQFHSSFPLELEGRISPTTFSEIINDINSLLVSAHNPTRLWIDNSIAILTFYISTLLVKGHYQRTMEELDRIISKYNEETLHPVGLSLVDPRKTAFLFIELEYF